MAEEGNGKAHFVDERVDRMDAVNQALFGGLAAIRGMRQDGWINPVTGLGVQNKDQRLVSNFQRRQNLITRAEIEMMYEQDPIFARGIDAIPEHATRRWIKITGSMSDEPGSVDEDFGKSVLDKLDELDAQNKFYDLMRLDRLDGGAAMLIGADDNQTPDKPLIPERIKSVKHINVMSRYETFPAEWDVDPLSPNFRQPLYFIFNGYDSPTPVGQKVHYSRVIRLTGIQITERLQMARNGWGIPHAERVYDSLRQFNSVFDYAENLFKSMVQGVMTIEGLNQILAADQGQQTLLKRLSAIGLAASAFNMILLDTGETYEQRVAAFGGISEGMIRMMDKLSACFETPLSILFGQAPTGMSTDDKSGRTTFYDSIANKQRRLLRHPLFRVISAILHSKEGPTKGKQPASWDFQFLPLTEPTEQEHATARLTEAKTDETLILNQIISPLEARTRLMNDPKSPYTLVDTDGGLEAEEKAKEALKEFPLGDDKGPKEGASLIEGSKTAGKPGGAYPSSIPTGGEGSVGGVNAASSGSGTGRE